MIAAGRRLRPGSRTVLIAAIALGLVIAGGSCTKVDDLVQPSCTYAVSPPSASYGTSGGSGTLAVTAAGNCAWTASSGASWLTITGDSKGNGNGTIAYAVGANLATAGRSAPLTVAGQAAMISQAAAPPCAYAIDPASASYGASGGSGSVTVAVRDGCAWTATSNANWIAVTSGSSGSGGGHVGYSVAANTSLSGRTGTIAIAGQTFTITQAAAEPCTYAVGQGASFPAAGGTGTVAVTTTAACAWTATSNVNWIAIGTGGSHTGSGSVDYVVAANVSASARTGTLTVAGQTVTVTQAAACVYTLGSTSKSFTAAGGTGSVSVTTIGGCTWTATSNDSWITVVSGASGSGAGTVQYAVAANSSKKVRTGTLTIAGQTFTITQDGMP